jgi:hypothetical protein
MRSIGIGYHEIGLLGVELDSKMRYINKSGYHVWEPNE